MNAQDCLGEVSTYEGSRRLFSTNYIKPTKGDFAGKRSQMENALLALKEFTGDFAENNIYKWINHILAGGCAEMPSFTALEPMEMLFGICTTPAVKVVSMEKALFHIIEATRHIRDDAFYFKFNEKGMCFQMEFGWSEVRMSLTCSKAPALHILSVNMDSSGYIETAIRNTLNRMGLTDKYGHFIDVLNKLTSGYSEDEFIGQEAGLIYKEGIFTPFGDGLKQCAMLRFVFERWSLSDERLKVEVIASLLLMSYDFMEHGVLKIFISLSAAEDTENCLFRAYKIIE